MTFPQFIVAREAVIKIPSSVLVTLFFGMISSRNYLYDVQNLTYNSYHQTLLEDSTDKCQERLE